MNSRRLTSAPKAETSILPAQTRELEAKAATCSHWVSPAINVRKSPGQTKRRLHNFQDNELGTLFSYIFLPIAVEGLSGATN
jgi:hypothetical protein